jgi:catechol 2,3-dioxygenase
MSKQAPPQQLEPFTIDPATRIGRVTLAVSNLERATTYYQQVIGLTPLNQDAHSAELGSNGKPLIRLEARPGGKRYPRATGLFHLALLLPTRQDLGHWLKHYVASQQRMIDGAGDHLVSEALYLSDLEGNGLELYQDRPRDTWEYDGERVKMATLAVDLPALVAEAPDHPWSKLPPETTLGHIHLQVNDVAKAVWFYHDVLGFGAMAEYPGAGFLGAGGYHHHIGVNVWHSAGAEPPPPGSLGLVNFEIRLPTKNVQDTLLARLDKLDYPFEWSDDMPLVQDPSGNRVLLTVK